MKLKLIKTCSGCPEQYDVFHEDCNTRIGYLRLRHGYFYAQSIPDDTIVYCDNCLGDGFFADSERHEQLTKACKAILNHQGEINKIIQYEIINGES